MIKPHNSIMAATLLKFGFTRPDKNNIMGKSDSNPTNSQDENNNNVSPSESTKLQRHFCTRWLSEYRLLIFGDSLKTMRCKFCVLSKQLNSFAKEGSKNFQRSALERHQRSDDHILATSNKKQSEVLTKIVNTKFEKMKPAVTAMVNTVMLMIEEEISDRKFEKLITLQIENGCEALKSTTSSITYTHSDSFKCMEDVLGEAAQKEIDSVIEKSHFIGIMVDESIDVAIHKKLILYIKVVINGISKILFGGNIEVTNGKAKTITAAIIKYMTDHNFSFHKLVGFASDGANTMVGRLNGVSTQLKILIRG